MLRISTTTIEAFRRLLQTEYGSEAELIAQIKGEPFTPSWQMEAGTAWDRTLQTCHGPFDADSRFFESGFWFDASAIDMSQYHIGPGAWQVKQTRPMMTGPVDLGILVVAQIDHCRGLLIQENKAKFSTPDARDYERSLQWRFYLWVHGAAEVRYNLFDFADPKPGIITVEDADGYPKEVEEDGGYCELRNIVSFNFWTYPGLEADCRRWVREFLEWAASKGLLPYLNRESSTPEAA